MTYLKRLLILAASSLALAGCDRKSSAPDVDPQITAIAQDIATRIMANPQPGAGVTVQTANAAGKLVRITVRVPEDDPGSEFFSFPDGRQTDVINALQTIVCETPGIDRFKQAQGVVQAYIDDIDGDRVAVIFPDDCR